MAAYDIAHLTGDLTALLDHFGYEDALFVGHDWGALVVWALAVMHPQRVAGLINLSVPFLVRGKREWVGFWEEQLGPDFYIVHFNRQPGVADAAFDADPERFLRNLYRTGHWRSPMPAAQPGMALIHLAQTDTPAGELMMSEAELAVFVESFRRSGFTSGLNWYRNFTRNWEILGRFPERVGQPALMIYGRYDMVPQSEALPSIAPDLEVQTLECGHWNPTGGTRSNQPTDAGLAGVAIPPVSLRSPRRRKPICNQYTALVESSRQHRNCADRHSRQLAFEQVFPNFARAHLAHRVKQNPTYFPLRTP